MKKILFGITSLTFGGAERVLVDLTNQLCKEYEVSILTIYDKGELKKQLNNKIKVYSIFDKSFNEYSKFEVLRNTFYLMNKAELPEGYDVYISFLEGPVTRLFSKNVGTKKGVRLNNIKKIAWVHNDISKVFGNSLKAKIKKIFDKKVYKKFDNVVFVSKENQEDFKKVYGKDIKTSVIRNYLDYNAVINKANEKVVLPFDDRDINLVSVCRLVDQKALDRFISVHSKLEKSGLHSKVYIIGDGPNRLKLQKQIDSLNETENFYLLGQKENPYPFIKNADYFCLLSYYEGYGMVLDEAKILGKKIIITNTAAKESVENYDLAHVVENTEDGIFIGLKNILSTDISNNKIKSDYSIENTKEYYSRIIKKIQSIID